MSMEDFENCMRGEYNQDAEAVQFIVQIFQLGGEDILKKIKDNWATLAAGAGVVATLVKWGNKSWIVKFLEPIFADVGAAVLELLAAMLVGLAFGAILLAIEAGISCAPRAAQ
jgi:hypothetical protein